MGDVRGLGILLLDHIGLRFIEKRDHRSQNRACCCEFPVDDAPGDLSRLASQAHKSNESWLEWSKASYTAHS